MLGLFQQLSPPPVGGVDTGSALQPGFRGIVTSLIKPPLVFCAQVEDMFGITVSRPLRQAFLHGECLGVAKKEPGFIDSQPAAQATRVR